MTKIRNQKTADCSAYELLVAEEELILHAQMLIQRVLNAQGISQKQLADKMGVGESYVSQMLGLSPRNLTLRTIARVMNALGVKATLVLDDYIEARAKSAVQTAAETTDATADETAEACNDNAKAIASRMASKKLSQVWAEVLELPSGKHPRRGRADAKAYASFEPSVQEMDMKMALAA